MAITIDDNADKMRLNINAHKKPSILIPSTNLSARIVMIALMMNKNIPSVRMVMGKVKMINNGRTIAFNIASTNAKMIAVENESI